ncbi:winged helix-turn-helix transcriptional regulator [Kitasatospora sp. NPDC101155]|uniref:winged helix-turn-helix transcriptional regulator n=1 Tax=Kitasatospora sp. NPDC101155 TaxID=3364097 RepID=UPI0038150C53
MSPHRPTSRPAAGAPGVPRNRQRLRSNNEWLLLELLRTGGGSSRAQLARDAGLSKPTVSAAPAELERAGLVRGAGLLSPERGRTAVLSAVLAPDPVVLGGGIGSSADLLLEPLEQALHKLSPMRPALAPSLLGEEAALLGAVSTALETARPEVFECRTAGLR